MKKQEGFTLLEMLIAAVIFSIGLLGLAKMQAQSLRLTHNSLLRTTATLMAADMADRMRANLVATDLGLSSPYNNAAGGNSPNCFSTGCTPAQMAAQDIYDWNAALKESLPNGAGLVCVDSTAKDGDTPSAPACDNLPSASGKIVYAIKVWWSERAGESQPDTLRQHVLEFAP